MKTKTKSKDTEMRAYKELVKPVNSQKESGVFKAQSLCMEFSPHNCDGMNKSLGEPEQGLLF